MPKIDENNLRDEELRSGFNPGDADDETFTLKSASDYPGNIPDLSGEEIDPDEFAGSDAGEDIHAPDGGSVWDLFDEEAAPENETPSEEFAEDFAEEFSEEEQFEEPSEAAPEEFAIDELEDFEQEEVTPDESLTEELVDNFLDDEMPEEQPDEENKDSKIFDFGAVFPDEDTPETEEIAEEPDDIDTQDDIVSDEDLFPDSFKEAEESGDEAMDESGEFPGSDIFPDTGEEPMDAAFPAGGSAAEESFPEIEDFPEDSFQEDELPEELPEDILPQDEEPDEAFEQEIATYMDEDAVDEEEAQREFENIVIDEDLRSLLEEEIERTKERREKVFGPAATVQQDEKDLKPLPELAPIEQIPTKTEVVDFSDIPADRPSTYGLSEEQPQDDLRKPSKKSEPAVKPEKPVKEKKEKVKKEKVKKEKIKKERKPNPFFIYYAGLSAATIAFAVLGFAAYYLGLDNMFTNHIKSAYHTISEMFGTDAKSAVAGGPDVAVSKKAEAEVSHSQEAVQSEQAAPQETEIHETKTPAVEIETKKPEPKPEPETKPAEKPVQKPVVKKEHIVKPAKPAKTAKFKPGTDIASVHTTNKYPIREIAPLSEEGIFTVQVYSSPSREDAEDWMQKLINKRVDNAFISTQKVRDVTYYRVRFGRYETRQKAKDAALKYGFSQAWVDRVK